MIPNHPQGTRSYGTSMPTEVPNTKTMIEMKENLKHLIKSHIEERVYASMLLSDLAYCYCKMGLNGHKHKLEHESCKAYKEMYLLKKYYYCVFEEMPKISVQYEYKEHAKSIDDIHNKLYESISKAKESLEEIFKVVNMCHLFEEMGLLFDLQACYEEQKYILESKMKRSQMFGYDVAYILLHDEKHMDNHKRYERIKEKIKKEYEGHY